jgi:hypothetical protein
MRQVADRQIFVPECTAVMVSADGHTGYIVTAKHCFAEPETSHITELRVRFVWEQMQSLERDNGFRLPLILTNGQRAWKAASSGADVAGIPLANLQGPEPQGQRIDAVGFQDFATEEDLYEGASIFIYGFPGFVDAAHLTRPITRGGIVAWIDPSGASSHPFLVDAAIFPGNSGSPIFKVPGGLTRTGNFAVGGKVALLGIVVRTYQAPLVLPSQQQLPITGLGSLGVVEPTSQIIQLLKDFGAQFVAPTPHP